GRGAAGAAVLDDGVDQQADRQGGTDGGGGLEEAGQEDGGDPAPVGLPGQPEQCRHRSPRQSGADATRAGSVHEGFFLGVGPSVLPRAGPGVRVARYANFRKKESRPGSGPKARRQAGSKKIGCLEAAEPVEDVQDRQAVGGAVQRDEADVLAVRAAAPAAVVAPAELSRLGNRLKAEHVGTGGELKHWWIPFRTCEVSPGVPSVVFDREAQVPPMGTLCRPSKW